MKLNKILIAAVAVLVLTSACFAQTMQHGKSFYNPKPMNRFPNTKSGRLVLVGDFHTHTEWGHGGLSVEDRIMDAYNWGMDILAITEHGNIQGAVANTPADSKWLPKDAKHYTPIINDNGLVMPRQPMDLHKIAIPLAKKYGIIYFPGVETGIAGKEHIVAFNIPKDYKSDAYDHWLAEDPGQGEAVYYRDRFKELCSDGGFMIYVHPHYGYAREQVQWGVDNNYIRGVEVHNGSTSGPENKEWGATDGEVGWRWYGSFDYALKHNIGIYANTDAHGDKGPTFTLVLAKERTHESVMEACNELRTVGYFDNMLWGRERDVDDIVSACVDVEKIKLDSNLTMVRITNKSPMEMSVSVLDRDIVIPAYNNVLVRNETGKKNVTITFKNVWTSEKTRLIKRY